MQTFTAFQYILIDIANCYGMDKELFETRIQWVKDNRHNLESLVTQSDDPALYTKAVLALRDVEAGKPTGHMISLDGVNSGTQVLSVLTNCTKGCKATGLIDTGTRPDAYSAVTNAMNNLLAQQGIEGITVARKDAKQAVMTASFGSSAVPKRIFGESMVEYFDEACLEVAPGAFNLMPKLINSWSAHKTSVEWTVVDGFEVYIPTLNKGSTTVRIDELDGAGVTFEYFENAPLEYSKANAANLTHSLDALVMRNMVRRCSYDMDSLTEIKSLLEIHILQCNLGFKPETKDTKLSRYVDLAISHKFYDPVFFSFLNECLVSQLPLEVADKLNTLAAKMLVYPRFDLITIHDA